MSIGRASPAESQTCSTLSLVQITIKPESHVMTQDERCSLSYPGLATHYICHRVEADVLGLPREPFQTVERRPDGILTAFWEWVG